MRTDPLEHRAPPLTLFEDDALLVCVKPRGVLAAADASGAVSMAALLAPRAVYPVHRLDRDVTGVMVFAKTKAAAAWLSGEKAALQKDYLAVTEGVPPQSEAELTDLLFHDRVRNKTYVVKRRRAGVKEARLVYRLLAALPGGRTRSACSSPVGGCRSAATGNTARRAAETSACLRGGCPSAIRTARSCASRCRRRSSRRSCARLFWQISRNRL